MLLIGIPTSVKAGPANHETPASLAGIADLLGIQTICTQRLMPQAGVSGWPLWPEITARHIRWARCS